MGRELKHDQSFLVDKRGYTEVRGLCEPWLLASVLTTHRVPSTS
jgi:hypothetical protein